MRWLVLLETDDGDRPPSRWGAALLALLVVLNLTAAIILWAIRS